MELIQWVTVVQGANALGQMNHFVKDDTLNVFRLPVGWQFLVNGQLGGQLNSNNAGQYDKLVQGCLSSGAALCILDVHNYARWNGKIVGQGGPTNAQLADLWKQLATKYGKQSKIAFGVMNEPHVCCLSPLALLVDVLIEAHRIFRISKRGPPPSKKLSRRSAAPVQQATLSSSPATATRRPRALYLRALPPRWLL